MYILPIFYYHDTLFFFKKNCKILNVLYFTFMNTNISFLRLPNISSTIVIHLRDGIDMNESVRKQIMEADLNAFQNIFFSLKNHNQPTSECFEIILELRRKLKESGKSFFLVEVPPSLIPVISNIGIPSIECFTSLAEAVMSVGE